MAAGLNHFLHPEFYKKIMPLWLPCHFTLIIISGILEILFAVLLLFIPTRPLAAWCIIVLLVVIFPANIQMMLNYLYQHNPQLWISILRLPLQIFLILWAYAFTKPVVLLSK